MTIQIVQTLVDGTSHYRQVVPLDGVNYILDFDYNSRDFRWYLSLSNIDDTPIQGCTGIRLVANYPACFRSTSDNRPAGQFLLVSDVGDPGLYDLGGDTYLAYIPEEDLATIEEELEAEA